MVHFILNYLPLCFKSLNKMMRFRILSIFILALLCLCNYAKSHEGESISTFTLEDQIKKNDSKIEYMGGARARAYTYDPKVLRFVWDVLERHNMYRQRHGVPPLVLSQQLNEESQIWADKLARSKSFEHRENRKYGENLYKKWNSFHELQAYEVVDAWYSEVSNYNYSDYPVVGHFTQLIWRDSRELGVGIARDRSGTYYVVCNYYPPGNIV